MTLATSRTEVGVERLEVSAYEIPTDEPESDGTLEWDSTTLVVVEAHAGGRAGLGFTYAPAAAGKLVEKQRIPVQDLFADRPCTFTVARIVDHPDLVTL